MKKIKNIQVKNFTTALLLLTVHFGHAQSKTGIVHYEQIIEMALPDSIPQDPQTAAIYAMMPKDIRTNTVLYFNEVTALYENDKETKLNENVDPHSIEAQIHHAMNKRQLNKFYTDLAIHKTYNQTEFMDRKFLVEGDIEKVKWKMTGTQKLILNIPCQEAVRHDSTQDVSVWFAPSIPVPFGPSTFGGLPGLILQVEYKTEGSKFMISPKNIDLNGFDKALIVKPSEGKNMSKDEYDKMVKKKTKEMMESGGGGDGVIIEIR